MKVTERPSWLSQDLSEREQQILNLTASGLADKSVAAQLNISIHTVRAYWERIKHKASDMPRTAVISGYVRATAANSLIPTAATEENLGKELEWQQAAIYYATALKHVEKSLQMAERAAKLLNRYPRLSFQATSLEEVCNGACELLVKEGGYEMAWVGLRDSGPEKKVLLAGSYGDDHGYLDGLDIRWDEGPLGEGPAGTAIRTGETQVNRDFLVNPATVLWRDKALKSGFQSSIGMPLMGRHGVVGVLSAYCREPDAFDSTESRLLEILANDLSLRIESLAPELTEPSGLSK